MHIGINAFFLGQPATGSGQYTWHLLRALADTNKENDYLPIGPSRRAKGMGLQALDLRTSDFGKNLAKLWFEQVTFPSVCQREGVDAAHVPYFAPPLHSTTPTVVTIHDLIPLILPAYRGSPLVRLYTRLVSIAAKRADAIIADSKASKRDIVRLLGIPAERVQVIYLAVDRRFRPITDEAHLKDVRRRYHLPADYILYLGGLDQRKNLAALLKAFKRLTSDLQLVIAGRLPARDTPFFPDPRRMVRELDLEERVAFIGWVPEEDKPALYSMAKLFVFPSLYEGFGLPPLEAMACGTPVIASNASSLPEVVGDAGLLIDPHDAAGLAEAMAALLDDERLRKGLGQRGFERARRFSWEETARETLKVYQEVVGWSRKPS